MWRRLPIATIALLFFACTKTEASGAAQEGEKSSAPEQEVLGAEFGRGTQPDIILILADDMGYGDWEPTGGPMRTPNLMKLCEEGVRLDRYYTHSLCTPTRTALVGGMSPNRSGMAFSPLRRWESRSLPLGTVTLAERLQPAGYQTALVGKWHLGQAEAWMHPNQRGFDHFYGFLTGALHYFTHRSGNFGLDWQRNGESVDEKGYVTTLLGEEAAHWIDDQDKERPLFLYLPFSAPHSPLMAPEEFILPYKEEVPDLERRKFCGMVAAMDAAIGDVLEAVERRGRGNTLVIFLSDNGASKREHGSNGPLRGNKGSTYEGALRVPAVLRWPGHLPEGEVSHDVIQVLDWMPTLMHFAGVEADPKLDGRNVAHKLFEPVLELADAASREDMFFGALTTPSLSYAVIRWPWKFVFRVRFANEGITRELFRIDSDPSEKVNLKAEHPELADELEKALRAWMKEQAPGNVFEKPKEVTLGAAPQGWEEPEDWADVPR
ncbi:MAG: sulfatase-like hydrolase/transferase [Planctomycetota bacterium]|nr:sulfatase-like hydrolase/transferase [Planctomycetota bacterium]MDA1113328.1 sulfatase-like hydrolase/transferase [Planctomycetota bacterium]